MTKQSKQSDGKITDTKCYPIKQLRASRCQKHMPCNMISRWVEVTRDRIYSKTSTIYTVKILNRKRYLKNNQLSSLKSTLFEKLCFIKNCNIWTNFHLRR